MGRKSAGCPKNTTFSEIPKSRATNIFMLLSLSEGMPMALFDAMALKRPCPGLDFSEY